MSLKTYFKVVSHQIKTGLRPLEGNTHQERLENYYHEQSEDYDSFRKKSFLAGREELFQLMSQGEGGIWVDLGGATGGNFDSIQDSVHKFQKIYIVDLSTSLLNIARQRIVDKHWHNVEAVEMDVTKFMPTEGHVDIVTFSYSLTMMPNWFEVIDHAKKLLKPGGLIGVVDFYVSQNFHKPGFQKHSWLVRSFWPVWFGLNNVYLSPNHLEYLNYHFEPMQIKEGMTVMSFPPGFKAPYYFFTGKKNSES